MNHNSSWSAVASCLRLPSPETRARPRPPVGAASSDGGRRWSANGATASGLETACAVESCCRSHCPSPSCPPAAANGLDASATSWRRARPSLTAPMPIVSSQPEFLTTGELSITTVKANTTQTQRYHLDTRFGAVQPLQHFLIFSSFIV